MAAAPTMAPPKKLRGDTARVDSENLFNIEFSSVASRSEGGALYFPSEFGRTKDFGVVHQCHEAGPIGIPLMQRAKEIEQSFTRGAALGHIRCTPRSTDESGEIEALEVGKAFSFGR